jgi:hypothetical protein
MRNIFSHWSCRARAACAMALVIMVGAARPARADGLPSFFMRVFALTDDGRLLLFWAGIPQSVRRSGS